MSDEKIAGVSSGVGAELESVREIEEGDVFCEEDGEHIGTYECKAGPAIELSMLYKGHWFIYKLDRKEKYEPTSD